MWGSLRALLACACVARAASPSPPCVTHAVVAAAHFGDDAQSLALSDSLLTQHAAAAAAYLPRSALFLVVENARAETARGAAAAADRNLTYARNGDYPNFGFELGAWRWALLKVLPNAGLCDDAVVYLTQDTLIVNAPPVAHPPRGMNATRVFRFDGATQLLGVPHAERHIAAAAADAFGRCGLDRSLAVVGRRETFEACYGPNLAGPYDKWRSLLERGFFDMLRVASKLDEQRSERIIGLFLARDPRTRDVGSLGGDYRAAELDPRGKKGLPFRKVRGSRLRPKEKWHRRRRER